MSLTWDKFQRECEILTPNLLKVVSAVVSDIPVAPAEKKSIHILHTIATGFHGRSQERFGLHSCIKFLLVHG